MKAVLATVFIALSTTPWFVGGAPSQLQQRSVERSPGGRNVTLVQQKEQNPSQLSSLWRGSEGGSLLRSDVDKFGGGGGIDVRGGEEEGVTSLTTTKQPLFNPITESNNLQDQLNELQRSHRNKGELRRKEEAKAWINRDGDSEGDDTDQVGGTIQTITLGKEYTPQDIAEYIFVGGDERGVAVGISDLLNDGLMLSQDDVIKFLETVKSELNDLRDRYEMFLSHVTSSPPPLITNTGRTIPQGGVPGDEVTSPS